ncbi:signal protein [Sphingomonas sp. Leaf23]|uniref:methyl-accepting chemotaxis protein n=1 Tax=Sphingomonas sp. Leaf23 TaxID=1735689 RepID=UPI0006F63CEB|nr:methyl-accepting chemotaxis protein [Sphingomonas sp. Leaf23]KQM87189.1 signal protein [Sphingomonas sp. Leaf23]
MHSINRMVLAAIAAIALLVLGSAGASVWSNGQQADARANITRGSALLRNHMTADMMHDTIRGDVLSVLRAASAGDLDLAEHRRALVEDSAALRKALQTDAAYSDAPAVVAQARRITPLVDAYIDTAGRIADAAATDPARATALLPGFLEAFEKLEGGMSTLSDAIESHLRDVGEQATATATFAKLLLAATTIATFGVILAIGFATRRFVVAPLLALVGTLQRMTSGDMAVTIPVNGRRDELGQLAGATRDLRDQLIAAERAKGEQTTLIVDSFGTALARLAEGDLVSRVDADLTGPFARIKADFNAAVTALQTTLSTVTEAASSINNGADDIRQASDDLSQRTEQQAASLEETAAAMDEITSTVRETAAGAAQANRIVGEARHEADQSGEIVRRAVEAMRGIEHASAEISDIISVIDGISFQTNLLALNAGVEAARAGDAGKGFAVVASEVRALAQRSADAAKDVKTRITASSTQIGTGVQLVGETGEALARIINRIGEIDGLVANIAASAERQATGLHQINTAVSEMDGMTQQNAAMVEEATAAVRSLASDADGMTRQITSFRLGDTPPRAAPARQAPSRPTSVVPMRPRVAGNTALAMEEDDWSSF